MAKEVSRFLITASPDQEAAAVASGSWLAGVICDHYGFYAPAFATGLAFNIANFAIIAVLVVLCRGTLAHWTAARVR